MSIQDDWLAAFEALKSVYVDGAYSNMALNEAIPRHRGCRDSFVRNLVKVTIRQTVTLDHIISLLARNGLKGIRPRTLIIIRMGLCCLRDMDSVPDHAAVSEAVSLARTAARGTDRFVNAVLRSYIRRRSEFESSGQNSGFDPPYLANIADDISRMSVKYSMPEDLVSLITSQYGGDAEAVLAGLNSFPPLVLRVNTLKTSRADLVRELEDSGITAKAAMESCRAVIASGSGIMNTPMYREGLFTVQSLPSILAIEALAPSPGSTVLDMCAAPGGKSLMMAELMGNSGMITACDIHEHRLELIRSAVCRTGAEIIETRLADGTSYDSSLDSVYDYVLADVPCSGLGVMGTKPEIRLRTDTGTFTELADIQLEILRNAFRYAKPGGRICYSTCTINRNENEGVVKRFLDGLHISRQDAGDELPSERFCDGMPVTSDRRTEGCFARVVEMNTILPYNNMIGFYYCIIEKQA